MVALEIIDVRKTVGRKNNFKLNFFAMYLVRNNEKIHFSFKNSEKYRTQALINFIYSYTVQIKIFVNYF